jgi:hypothetical protein
MAKKTIAKPQPKAKTIVRVKSTDLTKCIAATSALAATASVGSHDKTVMSRVTALLTALLDGHKVKVQKAFDIDAELAKFDGLLLECDGMSRVLSFSLSQMGVRHVVKQGQLLVDGQKVVPIHQWIELSDGRLVDYRARMWAGKNDEIPHGVFSPADFKRVQYSGFAFDPNVDEKLFKLLTTPIVPVPLQKADAPATPTVVPAGP